MTLPRFRLPLTQTKVAISHQRQLASCSLCVAKRAYATQPRHPTASSLLSDTLGQRASQRASNVGPFQLGLNSQSFAEQERPKPWSQLSGGGKGACHVWHPAYCVRLQAHRDMSSGARERAYGEPRRNSRRRRPDDGARLRAHVRALLAQLADCALQ
jgi:hypothetical protein